MSRILMGGIAALLVAAVGFVVLGEALKPKQSFTGALQGTFPSAGELSEWSVRFLPVAESAEMQRAVGEMLNFDQAAYAQYINGPTEVSLYAAYWSPGKMSHRLIAVHTPDVCWLGAGWERMEGYQTRLELLVGQWRATRAAQRPELKVTESLNLQPVGRFPWEYRKFRLAERTEYVVFLHLVGGRALGYGVEGVPPWYSVIGDLLDRGLRQREEQFFVRISGNRPLPELLATEPVRQFLQKFEREALLTGKGSANNPS
jgi:hypothetical protein